MFKITSGRGFAMVFANGWTVSVQFGGGNYCANRDAKWIDNAEVGEKGCVNAEIAAWSAQDAWYDFGTDTVKGWVTPDEVAEFIAMIAAYPKETAAAEAPASLDE